MSRLHDATQRLDAVLDRLERAVTARAADPAGTAGGSDDAGLRAALAKAEAENASLQDLAETVSGRLDDAIQRLKTVLEA